MASPGFPGAPGWAGGRRAGKASRASGFAPRSPAGPNPITGSCKYHSAAHVSAQIASRISDGPGRRPPPPRNQRPKRHQIRPRRQPGPGFSLAHRRRRRRRSTIPIPSSENTQHRRKQQHMRQIAVRQQMHPRPQRQRPQQRLPRHARRCPGASGSNPAARPSKAKGLAAPTPNTASAPTTGITIFTAQRCQICWSHRGTKGARPAARISHYNSPSDSTENTAV